MGVETLIRDRFTAAKEYDATLNLTQATVSALKSGEARSQYAKQEQAAARLATSNAFARPGGPRRDLQLEALAEVLRGERLVHCHSYRQDEILMLCNVARDFGFKIGTFQHALEGYQNRPTPSATPRPAALAASPTGGRTRLRCRTPFPRLSRSCTMWASMSASTRTAMSWRGGSMWMRPRRSSTATSPPKEP